MRESATPLNDEYLEDEQLQAMQPQPLAIIDMHYCERSHMLVLVLEDGSCAMCGAPSGLGASGSSLNPLRELAFSHWVCEAGRGATRARIGACSQMVAVGCSNGELALFRCVCMCTSP